MELEDVMVATLSLAEVSFVSVYDWITEKGINRQLRLIKIHIYPDDDGRKSSGYTLHDDR
jgi:hypothetical protein